MYGTRPIFRIRSPIQLDYRDSLSFVDWSRWWLTTCISSGWETSCPTLQLASEPARVSLLTKLTHSRDCGYVQNILKTLNITCFSALLYIYSFKSRLPSLHNVTPTSSSSLLSTSSPPPSSSLLSTSPPSLLPSSPHHHPHFLLLRVCSRSSPGDCLGLSLSCFARG